MKNQRMEHGRRKGNIQTNFRYYLLLASDDKLQKSALT